MRYVIVCVVKGEAGNFNDEMRKDIFEKFKAKSSKLPAHFTIKAPFEYDKSIKDLEDALYKFSKKEKKAEFKMNKYNHFDDRVIYMNVNMSNEGKVLHVTLTSKKVPPIYNEVWEYVNKYSFNFNCYFDNISIFKWVDNNWKLHKEFLIEN